jgi:3,4-dihydroxy 2-butanone 4-phosphate synthase/GTP cyclohydrolase II
VSDPGPDRLRRTIAALAKARPVVVVDPAADLGGLVVAAESATTSAVAFMVRHTSGFLCAAAPPWVLDRLRISPGRPDERRAWRAGYGVSVDGTEGTGTGISAAARARPSECSPTRPRGPPISFDQDT